MAKVPPAPRQVPLLADSIATLALAAATLDDTEKVRIAGENRLRSLAGHWERDGEIYGFGLTPPGLDPGSDSLVRDILHVVQGRIAVATHAGARVRPPQLWDPVAHQDVWHLALTVLGIAHAEHQAEKHLKATFRKHPLWPWVVAQHGIGEKQGARLLATIGDPYIRPEITRKDDNGNITVEPSRPRTVSELWAYCGLHTIDGVAARRQKFAKSNWSTMAKSRAFLVAEACMKTLRDPCRRLVGGDYATHVEGCHCSPYRLTYDRVRERLADAVHREECVRCGPSGKPALAGSPLSMAHKKNWALRIAAKEILKDLWREARRLHDQAAC